MPGLDGWGVICVSGVRAPPPVIAMSGMFRDEALDRGAVSRHISGYLSKPFSRDVLVQTCDGVLRAAQEGSGPMWPTGVSSRGETW